MHLTHRCEIAHGGQFWKVKRRKSMSILGMTHLMPFSWAKSWLLSAMRTLYL